MSNYGKKYTAATKKTAVDAVNSGTPIGVISKKLGCTAQSVRGWLKANHTAAPLPVAPNVSIEDTRIANVDVRTLLVENRKLKMLLVDALLREDACHGRRPNLWT